MIIWAAGPCPPYPAGCRLVSAQRHGTQLGWNDDGDFGPWPPIEDPENVDQRRADLGLATLAEVFETAAVHQPTRRPIEHVLNRRRREQDFANQVGWRSDTDS